MYINLYINKIYSSFKEVNLNILFGISFFVLITLFYVEYGKKIIWKKLI